MGVSVLLKWLMDKHYLTGFICIVSIDSTMNTRSQMVPLKSLVKFNETLYPITANVEAQNHT